MAIAIDLDDVSENEEDARDTRSGGSSGLLSSVMRYLLVDSKIPRRNLPSVARSSERFALRLRNLSGEFDASEARLSGYFTTLIVEVEN